VLVFGAVRLDLASPRQQVRVGRVASDEPADPDVADESSQTEQLFRDYAAEVNGLAAGGSRVIVLPA
jgi:hypothetical protein